MGPYSLSAAPVDPTEQQLAQQEGFPPGRWDACGRLDLNTTGLLLFCSDGRLTQRLLHPKAQVPRRYKAIVAGDFAKPAMAAAEEEVARVDERDTAEDGEEDEAYSLRTLLAGGVATTDGMFPATLISARHLASSEIAAAAYAAATATDDIFSTTAATMGDHDADEAMKHSRSGCGNGAPDSVAGVRRTVVALAEAKAKAAAEQSSSMFSEVVLEVTEGKYRMVRRLLANAGLPVLTLARLRYGPVSLKLLPPGAACHDLPEGEISWAQTLLRD